MATIHLFIASSLDGYIARPDGSLDWLEGHPNPDQLDYGYMDFLAGIDTVVMGRKTYETILGFGVEWPYGECDTYVVSRQAGLNIDSPRTEHLQVLDSEAISRLRQKSQKGIWLVGGGALITAFLNLEAIDEMLISLIPVIIGEGVPLFPGNPLETKFELVRAEPFSTGVVNLQYRRKADL
jgi:dihydrofolate reductase